MADNNSFVDSNGLLYFWQKIVNRIKSNIVNDLTSTETAKSLSAYQGKVLKDSIDAINGSLENAGAGDMLKSVYDTDSNGKVDKADDSDKFGGNTPDYFAKATDLDSYVKTADVGVASGVASLGTDGKVPESQLPETAPIEHEHTTADITDFATEMAKKADAEHTHDQDEINGLGNVIEEVTEIANGKCTPYVFDTVTELETALAEYTAYITDGTEMSDTNVLNGKTLKTGDVFYIRATDVPDYWWDETTSTKQILETTKVDLTVITNAEIDEIVASE